jgi:hypothetical protein
MSTLVRWSSKTQRAYARDLPGGGFAAIDVTPVLSLLRGRCYEACLLIERRSKRRSPDQQPLVIVTVIGKSVDAVVAQLLPAAESNPAIGAALLHREPIPV